MANLNDTIKNFQYAIEQLQDTVESKDLELSLLESERQDDLKPSILGTKISCTVSEMLMEILDFEKLKGKSERTEASKKRLIGLLHDTEELNTLSTQINKLKLINKNLFTKYKILQVDNFNLTSQLKKIQDAHEY